MSIEAKLANKNDNLRVFNVYLRNAHILEYIFMEKHTYKEQNTIMTKKLKMVVYTSGCIGFCMFRANVYRT